MAKINYVKSGIPPRPYMTKKQLKQSRSLLKNLVAVWDGLPEEKEPMQDAEFEIIEPAQLEQPKK